MAQHPPTSQAAVAMHTSQAAVAMQHGQILSTAPRRQTHLIDGNDLTVRLLHTAQATQEVPASWDDGHKTVSHYFREQHTVTTAGAGMSPDAVACQCRY
jgi:hypothetical protein